jgi:hypothetical protein
MACPLLCPRQLARVLKLPRQWLRQQALDGRLPCLRVGRRKLRFDLEAVRRRLTELAAEAPRRAAL